jgi:hypothetical protein
VDPVQLVLYDLFLGVIECGACGGNIGINFFIIYVNYRMYRRRGGGCTTTNYCGVQGALCLGHDAIRDALWASDSTDLNFGTHIAVHMVADAPPCHCCALLLCHAAVFCCPPRIPYLRNEVLEFPSDRVVLLGEMDRNTQSQVLPMMVHCDNTCVYKTVSEHSWTASPVACPIPDSAPQQTCIQWSIPGSTRWCAN